jgi:hypothetical protein
VAQAFLPVLVLKNPILLSEFRPPMNTDERR